MLVGSRVSLLLGYAALLSIILAATLFILNRINPMQGKSRIIIHCFLGLSGLICSGVNVYLGPENAKIISNVSFGLITIIIVTGLILKYVRAAGILRYQSSTIHPGIVLALFVILLFNWLSSYGIV